jgi:DNA polymerase-4
MDLVRGTVPRVEVLGLDEAYLDLEGLMSPRADMRRLVTQIKDATGLDASVGIGPNRLVAKVASDAEKPRGFVVLSREEACARFAGSPPGLIPGIGPKTVARLEAFGITTLGQLATMPVEPLVEAFGGRYGPDLQRRARFDGSDAVVPVRDAVSESRETTFDVDIADPAEMERRLRELALQLCVRLGEKDLRGRTIAIKVRLADFTTVTRARTLPVATNDPAVVSDLAAHLLREYAPPRPVRLLGVRVAAFQRGEPEAPVESPQLVLEI